MAEEVMDVEQSSANNESSFPDHIINHLLTCEDVYFKSQQRGDQELCEKEKREIANKIFATSKSGFLSRFGKHLKEEHLEYFKPFLKDENDGYAIGYYMAELNRYFTTTKRNKDIKNRRYGALKKLIDENYYFSEVEMMRRNPLLYNQLVGQYLTEDEKKKRDNIDTKNITFVNLLLESIDRDITRKKQKQQEEDEDDVREENDSSESEDDKEMKNNKNNSSEDETISKTFKWGEFSGLQESQPILQFNTQYFDKIPENVVMITATERRLLKEEFISIMYQNFLDGKDTEFDYSSVDYNDEYDDLELKTHDAEDSYFDSETPEDITPGDERMAGDDNNDTSEDELDKFMTRINSHLTVQQLSDDMNRL